ncbi:MAG: diguanylate cyclase [Rhodocyclales bacterium]|nr:diguanylate cyclase [Rhodocyclales bacterium]
MSEPGQLPRVLIVDDSRMVRASLIKHIRGHYDYREESDGEAGWQALVLDHSIQAVMTDLSMPVLDGFGLLERIRNSRLARIREMPVVMISGDEEESARERAKVLGVSDFITKGTGAAELLSRLESLIRLAAAQRELEKSRDRQVQDPDTGLFTRRYIELQAAQALSHATRHGSQVSVMLLGFDHFAKLRAEAGDEVTKQLQKRFARLLADKVRKEDSLGHYDDNCFVVVLPGASDASSEAFGHRLRVAIEGANVAVHGKKLELSVSIGIANCPADLVTSAGALLELAAQRLQLAMQSGGNQLVSIGNQLRVTPPAAAAPPPPPPPTLAQALELLRAGKGDALRPHAGKLVAELLPLLALIEQESGVDLSLAALKERFRDRS